MKTQSVDRYCMFYGRRRVDASLVEPPKKRGGLLDRSFQLHYTTYLTLTVSGASLLAFGAVFYFLNQNFQIFMSLAFDTHPGLVQHLEREVTWLKAFIIVSFFLILITTMFLTLRMTQKLVDPLAQMEKHLRKLTQGQWNISDLSTHDRDFKELLATYDYFYRSLRMTTESELELVKKLHVDPSNREAYAAWKTLMENKSRRLGIKPRNVMSEGKAKAASDEEPASKPAQRRVS
jgi:hypothetical protein